MNSCLRHTKLLKTIGFFFLAAVSYAQPSKDLHFIQLPFEGLSHPSVNCIFQDKTGFLWLGTINGLNRYDGYNYRIYQSHKDAVNGLSNNYINSISQDADENLWVGTKYGLNLLLKNEAQFKTFLPDDGNPNALINANIEVVYKDSQDRIWVGSWGGLSLYRKSTDDFINFSHNQQNENSISGNVVTTIMEDSKGRLWVGTAFSGLNLMDLSTNRFTRFQKHAEKRNCISGNSISAIYEDEKGQIWVGAQRGGLNRFHEASQTFKWYLNEEKRTSIASNTVYSIIEDQHGDLMVGGMNGGISVYNIEEDNFHRFDTYGNYNPFGSKASVFSHYKLRSGEIVIATSNGGVKIQDNYPTSISLHQHIWGNGQTLPMNNVSALAADQRGNFWIGTSGGGLCYLHSKSGKFTRVNGLKDKTVNCLYFDQSDGYLWIGTLENGLAKYSIEKKLFSHYQHLPDDPESIGSNHVTRLAKNNKGLWIGTDNGVSLFDTKKQSFTHFYQAIDKIEEIEIGRVNTLLIDNTGKLWIGSESGLAYFDKNHNAFKFHQYQTPPKGKNRDWISYLYEDTHNYIWMSTLDGDLILLDENRSALKPVISNPNYEITAVTNVVRDASGNFWVTCHEGLLKCQLDYSLHSIEVIGKFNESDGLQGNIFNSNTGLFSKPSGQILLGGLNGLNVISPSEINQNPNVPPLILTEIVVNGKKFSTNNQKELTAIDEVSISKKDVSNIDIYFAALNFVKPQKNQYAFILEGYENDWHYAGNNRVASYRNLAPGKYQLKAKAANNHGVWNSSTTNLGIVITSPGLGGQGLVPGLILVSLIGIVAAIIGYKRYSASQPDRISLRERIFKNHQTAKNKQVLSKKQHDEAFLEQVVNYVESNIANEELSIKNMCSELGLSRAKLFRKIKELTGKTVSGFIKDIRLEKARLYLEANPRSVGEVAFAIGFKSHAHFTRSFKEKFGMSPSSYVQGQ